MSKDLIPLLKAQNRAYGPLDYSFLTSLIKQNDIKRALDVGTGEGTFILGLANKTPGVKYNAIDASKELIDCAIVNKRQFKDRRVTFGCSFFDESFQADNFDMIIARFAVEHASDVDGFIKAVYRKLKRRGFFAIIEYYVDDGNIDDPVWREFKKRELALYKGVRSHPRLGMILPAAISRCGFKNVRSSFLQISPATVGLKPFLHLLRTQVQTYSRFDTKNWPKTYLNKLMRWCDRVESKGKDTDPMFFLTHTVGQRA